MWVQDDYSPASDSTQGLFNDLFFGGSGQVKVSRNAAGLKRFVLGSHRIPATQCV
jgi:hypothetical protein